MPRSPAKILTPLGLVAGQLKLPFPKPRAGGVGALRRGAQQYAKSRGLTYNPSGLREMQADGAFQHGVAQEYQRRLDTVGTPPESARRSYDVLKREVGEQFDLLTRPKERGGLGVQVEYVPELDNATIYPSHRELIADIRKGRMRVNKTGSNPNDTAVAHPFLSPEDNDKFRAVHDAFGHAAIGRSFSRHGEEAAYHSHAQMFSPEARPALAAETRGQNSMLNYGRSPGSFPDQGGFTMPAWATVDRRLTPRPSAPQQQERTRPRGLQQRQFRF